MGRISRPGPQPISRPLRVRRSPYGGASIPVERADDLGGSSEEFLVVLPHAAERGVVISVRGAGISIGGHLF